MLHECFPHPVLTLLKIWITGRRIFRGSGTNTSDFFALHCGQVSINEPPHADVHHQTQCQKNKRGGRTAVTHQRQWYAGYWHVAYHH